MQHEPLVEFAGHMLDLLLVVGRPESARDERLRFAAGKHHRTVGPRQHGGLGPDGADLVELAAIEPDAAFEHLLAQHLLLQLVKDLLGLDLSLGLAFGQRGHELVEHLVDALVVLELAADTHRLAERAVHLRLDLAGEVVAGFLFRRLRLLLANGAPQVVNPVHDLLDSGVRDLERGDHLGLAHFVRPGFHHHDALPRAGDDQVQTAGLSLRVGRVDDVVTVDEADAHPRGGFLDGNPGKRQRGGRAGNREHVRVIVCVRRQRERDDLRLVPPPVREQRTDRPINQPARQHLLFRRFALPLEEPTRNAA